MRLLLRDGSAAYSVGSSVEYRSGAGTQKGTCTVSWCLASKSILKEWAPSTHKYRVQGILNQKGIETKVTTQLQPVLVPDRNEVSAS